MEYWSCYTDYFHFFGSADDQTLQALPLRRQNWYQSDFHHLTSSRQAKDIDLKLRIQF